MKTKQNITVGGIVKAGLVGAAVWLAVVIVLTALTTICMDRGLINEESLNLAGTVVRMVSIFAGVALAVVMVQEKKIQAALITLGVALFMMIGGTVLFWDGIFTHFLLSLLGCVLSGAAAVAVNMIPRKGRKTAKVRYQYR